MSVHDHPLYPAWRSMRSRCNNPNNKSFPRYGGRGISVCERWASFAAFCEDMGSCPVGGTLERKNNDLGYFKDNCIWASRVEQARNRLTNRHLSVNGESMLIVEAAARFGVSRALIGKRLNLGWSEERAATTPANVTKRRFLNIGNETIGLSAASRRFGIPFKTLHHRINVLGWSDERAATTPSRRTTRRG